MSRNHCDTDTLPAQYPASVAFPLERDACERTADPLEYPGIEQMARLSDERMSTQDQIYIIRARLNSELCTQVFSLLLCHLLLEVSRDTG